MAGSISKFHIDDEGRECAQCGEYKEWKQFHKKFNMIHGHNSTCKKCRKKIYTKEYCPHKARDKSLRTKYGIGIKQYEQMLAAQHHGCKICGISQEEYGSNLAVDHCHATGKVRGLLCHSCNTAIGLLKENLGNFRKAMQYLTAAQGGLVEPSGLEEFAD